MSPNASEPCNLCSVGYILPENPGLWRRAVCSGSNSNQRTAIGYVEAWLLCWAVWVI